MEKPELIHYNGARHLQLYGLDPPLNPHQLGQPVDELVGTPVDILSYGLGMGQTFLYDTKVGTRFGEHATEHNSSVVWWRAAESLQRAPDSAFLYLRTRPFFIGLPLGWFTATAVWPVLARMVWGGL